MAITDEAYAKELAKQHPRVFPTRQTSGFKMQEISLSTKDLYHEAFNVSIATLVNMWVIRWQDKWISDEDLLEADDFWRITFVRLNNVGKIEKHYFVETDSKVYRIID